MKINRRSNGAWKTSLFTPFFAGGNLADFLQRFGGLVAVEELRQMCRDILQMVQQLRSCTILHRDFKAQNIVVSSARRLCLIDFGSAVEFKHRMALTGKELTTTHVRAPEVVCESSIYSYGVDVWAAGCVIWRVLTGGDIVFKNLRSKIIRTKHDQLKYQIRELQNILGTSVRCTRTGTITLGSAKVYDEIRSWGSRERNVARTFFNRRADQVKKKRTIPLDNSSTKDACSLVTKLLWWFEEERLTISRKSRWEERLIFLVPESDRAMTTDLKPKTPLFKRFYSYCDISKVRLTKRTSPKATGKKRARGGKTVIRKKKNKRIKRDIKDATKF